MRLVPFSTRVHRGEELAAPSLRTELDRMFDRMLRTQWPDDASPAGAWIPSVDISETESEIVLRAEVPGIKPEEIDITVSGDRLIISGEKSEQREEKDEHYYHCERRFGRFERTIELPEMANMEEVTADHTNGVLTIHVPKLETAKPKRIQIESRGGAKAQRKSVAVTDSDEGKQSKT